MKAHGARAEVTAPSAAPTPSAFRPLRQAFEEATARRPEARMAVCVYCDGRSVVDLWGGPAYGPEALHVLFSATKGVASICLATLHEAGRLDVEAPVCEIWPEFAARGKRRVTLAQLFSHQAGLPGIERPLALAQWADGTAAELLAGAAPRWRPGSAHGYHAWTFGVLADAVVRRVGGRSLGRLLADDVAGPLEADVWIGLPQEQDRRVVPVVPSSAGPAGALAEALADRGSLTHLAFRRRPGEGDPTIFNARELRAVELPAVNGVGSARGLARLYAACLGKVDGHQLLGDATLRAFTRPRTCGVDLVTREDTCFGVGFQLHSSRLPMLGPTSFGHEGIGGALAFADRAAGLSFAFVTDRMPPQGASDEAVPQLLAALARCVGAR